MKRMKLTLSLLVVAVSLLAFVSATENPAFADNCWRNVTANCTSQCNSSSITAACAAAWGINATAVTLLGGIFTSGIQDDPIGRQPITHQNVKCDCVYGYYKGMVYTTGICQEGNVGTVTTGNVDIPGCI